MKSKVVKIIIVMLTPIFIYGAAKIYQRNNLVLRFPPLIIDGVTVKLKAIEKREEAILVSTCVETDVYYPFIPHVSLIVNNQELPIENIYKVYGRLAEFWGEDNYCYHFLFTNLDNYSIHEVDEFKVNSILASIPYEREGQFNPLLLEKIQETYPSVDIEVIIEKGEGGGGGRLEIFNIPDGVTEEEIQIFIVEVANPFIEGPWIFDF